MDITGAKILIVGGGSGMGLALARRCLEDGANVVIAGRSREKLERARDSSATPAAIDIVSVDISQVVLVVELFRQVGPLDHIVSTAADIKDAYALLPSLELTAARRVVESKFYGPLLLAKYG